MRASEPLTTDFNHHPHHHLPEQLLLCLLSSGGGSLFAIHGDCEAYDTRTDRWHVVASMSTRRARVGVAAVGNRLYAVGG